VALLGGGLAAGALAQVPSPALPVTIDADRLEVRPDVDATATGDVRVQRGDIALRADRMSYDRTSAVARASGGVQLRLDGDVFRGNEVELNLDTYEGFVLGPDYFFAATQAGGRAERIDLAGRNRATVTRGDYTSCDRDGQGTPDWLLTADRLDIDVEANEGVAHGAVLRFLDVPILVLPTLTFPVTDERKSGWLPPSLGLDSRSGVEIGVPYYWNIAPSHDATLTPLIYSRRGAGGAAEFRYLQPQFSGQIHLHGLPNDREADRSRASGAWQHEGRFGSEWSYRADLQRVTDDDYWKDFSRNGARFTPRLLPQELQVERPFGSMGARWQVFGGVQQWQVLQGTDPSSFIVAPYQRSPQLGLRGAGAIGGLEYGVETEYNHFTRPSNDTVGAIEGQRAHVVGTLAWPLRSPAGFLIPSASVNAAAYDTDQAMSDGRTTAQRVIPTVAIDGGLVFERDTTWFGRDLRQTLEPRLVYANTPTRDQSALPLFDAALKDFNEVSIYSPNAFSGVDRVSDAHQLTAGVSTRFIEQSSGIERARLALVQRYLLRDQEVTIADQPPAERFSDVLLLASSTLTPKWTLDGSIQYSPSIDRTTRSILGARYSPGPFRTVGARYSFARNLTEQVEMGWQWPMFGPVEGEPRGGGACKGTAYTVGRLNYSLRDSRMADSLLGVEYDSGCWIARVVAEWSSTGPSEATTRIMLQLELVGLSRLGSNPLRTLKDNIPGYRLLRDDAPMPPEPRNYE
jgi:LPS-assembly protein